ncbi:MAG: outer membrane protein assembly factor [Hyphomicrobiales bacterium]
MVSLLLICLNQKSFGQIAIGKSDSSDDIDYFNPKQYIIGGVTVSGIKYLDPTVLTMLSGFTVGKKIRVPGDDIAEGIKKLWNQGLFDDIKVSVLKIEGDQIFLEIWLKERPRLSKFKFIGAKKSQVDDLRDELSLTRGDVVTENLLNRANHVIRRYFVNKGFYNVDVKIKEIADTTTTNGVVLYFKIDKNKKVKIYDINVEGNKALTAHQVKKAMKETKEKGQFTPTKDIEKLIYDVVKNTLKFNLDEIITTTQDYAHENIKIRIFKPSKYIESNFKDDLDNIIAKYQEIGYRDAAIVSDSIAKNDDNTISIYIKVDEGNKYYFRNINFVGNTVYSNEDLKNVLGIDKGDVYNKQLLETNLNFNQNGFDVSSLYLDNGYLFFNATPVEVNVVNDSIDLEIRIMEGKQARIDKVSIKGNDRTNDHVIMREIRTRPGELFNRSQVIRTTRELAQLKYFNQETIRPDIKPNWEKGTVDIEYSVEEQSADQIEVSGGYGYGTFIGTLGLSFNNFSLKNFFKKDSWKPIPSGDGQKLALRFQAYGKGYISYNVSFTEPWLGGKKPNAFTVGYNHSLFSNTGRNNVKQKFVIDGFNIGLARRLQWPDDFFTVGTFVNLQRYKLSNYSDIFAFQNSGNGDYYNINLSISISRNSVDNPLYPRSGSELSLTAEFTPPYSLFDGRDYSKLPANEKYKFIEYHKWKFSGGVYSELAPKLVLFSRAKFGFLGAYNNDLGITPFERFYLGGDGLSGYNNFDGREIIGMRGYKNESIKPNPSLAQGGAVYSKYTLEMRYPLTTSASSTIYAFTFLEAGNTWANFDQFEPFKLYRTAGFGVRIFLPIFGILGLDYGYGLDEIPGNPSASKGQFHFSINNSID